MISSHWYILASSARAWSALRSCCVWNWAAALTSALPQTGECCSVSRETPAMVLSGTDGVLEPLKPICGTQRRKRTFDKIPNAGQLALWRVLAQSNAPRRPLLVWLSHAIFVSLYPFRLFFLQKSSWICNIFQVWNYFWTKNWQRLFLVFMSVTSLASKWEEKEFFMKSKVGVCLMHRYVKNCQISGSKVGVRLVHGCVLYLGDYGDWKNKKWKRLRVKTCRQKKKINKTQTTKHTHTRTICLQKFSCFIVTTHLGLSTVPGKAFPRNVSTGCWTPQMCKRVDGQPNSRKCEACHVTIPYLSLHSGTSGTATVWISGRWPSHPVQLP